MVNRYSTRYKLLNKSEMYNNVFLKKGVKYLNHYSTAKFDFPSAEDMNKIRTFSHIWSVGDRYYKLSEKFYGNPNDWWVIALFNNKPTESDIILGEEILIPLPLETVIQYIKY